MADLADLCPNCGHDYAPHVDRCENCHHDLGAPNVRAAMAAGERAALEKRCRDALEYAASHGYRHVVEKFKQHAARSRAVICKNIGAVFGIAAQAKGSWLISSYHAQVAGGGRAPDGDDWDFARAHERRWFPNYSDKIQYGALSLTDTGLSGWGEVSLVLNETAIRGRASVGEENAVHFAQRLSSAEPFPKGFRATWDERGELCVAKLFKKVDATTGEADFAGILMSTPSDRDEANFVEVHIYGTLLLEGVECVRVARGYEKDFASLWATLDDRDIRVEFFDDEKVQA
ncbi:hypothetical protein OU994_13085 [Pseudoduganella sp. SL102]|uniref:hypothetical protein n=1 Tax=Pseudoduganella sp. SL102 TaxID=2995154 RepID=UPI00248AC7C2|nr:hypothetical protein [Pseudoduganella sp. SL102]WBS05140.1 hypothetical protein OU994_13085 [Pseudoduganella sp. SL102]